MKRREWKKDNVRWRSPGRAERQINRFDLLMIVTHPPIKGIAAKSEHKNIKMAYRLAFALQIRRWLAIHNRFDRPGSSAEVTSL